MENEKWHFVRSFVFENIVYENMRTGYHFRRVYIWVALQALQIRRIFFFFFTIRGHGNFRPIWGIFLLRAIAPINRARISRIYSDVYYIEFWLNVTILRAFSNSISCTKLLHEKKDTEKENIHFEFQFIPTNAAWYTLLCTETRDICLILLLFRQQCEINYPYILRSKSITVKPWIRYKTVYRD